KGKGQGALRKRGREARHPRQDPAEYLDRLIEVADIAQLAPVGQLVIDVRARRPRRHLIGDRRPRRDGLMGRQRGEQQRRTERSSHSAPPPFPTRRDPAGFLSAPTLKLWNPPEASAKP